MKKIFFNLTYLASILVVMSGCRQPDHQPGDAKPIPFRPAASIDLGQFLEQSHFVQLENTPESAFSTISKLIVRKGLMFFLDKKLEAVFCFDTTGKFRYRIQNIGRGPGEYQHLGCIWIQPETDELWLQSIWPSQIMAYNLDGRQLRHWPLAETGNESIFLSNNRLVSYRERSVNYPGKEKKAGLILTDDNGHLIRQISYFGDSTIFWRTEYQRHFETYGKSQLLLSQKDTILRIDPDGTVRPDLMMDWGKLTVPESMKKINFGDPDDRIFQEGRYLQGKDQLIAFGPIRIFQVYLNNHMELALADLESQTGTYSTVISGSLNQLPLLYPMTVSDRNELTGLYDLSTLLALQEMLNGDKLEGPEGKVFRDMKAIVESAIKQDRPIVWKAKIKSNWITKNE